MIVSHGQSADGLGVAEYEASRLGEARLRSLRQGALSCRQVGGHLWRRGAVVSRHQRDSNPGQPRTFNTCVPQARNSNQLSYLLLRTPHDVNEAQCIALCELDCVLHFILFYCVMKRCMVLYALRWVKYTSIIVQLLDTFHCILLPVLIVLYDDGIKKFMRTV